MNGLYKKDDIVIHVSNLDNQKLYVVKIEPYSDKRTKSMNSYYWQLLSQLASVLRTSKDELHEQLIKRYSQRDYISLLAHINPSNYFKYYDYQNTYKQHGNTFKSYLIYVRSSDMNKQDFSVLLDGLISECKECGISTLTTEQIAQLKYIENSR